MNNEDAVKQVLSDYYNAFSTLDVQSILPYFHQPAVLLGTLGVIAVPTPAAVVPIFGPVMEDLRQRKFRRSELSLQQFKLLSATSALAVGVAPYDTRLVVKSWSGWGLPTCYTKEMTVGSLPLWCYTIPTKLRPPNNRTYMLNR
jgi:hypothetical protein